MPLCAKQHPSHKICRRDSRRSFYHQKSIRCFHVSVAILTVAIGCDVITVNDIVASIVGDPWKARHVWSVRNREGNPTAGVDGRYAVQDSTRSQRSAEQTVWLHRRVEISWNKGILGLVPFIQSHDRRSLVLKDRFVRMDPNKQLFAQLASLKERTGVAYTQFSRQEQIQSHK